MFGNTLNPKNRDIDLLVVSDDFVDMFMFKRKKLITDYVISNIVIDPICITKKEYKRLVTSNSNFAKQMLKGEVIYESRDKRDTT